MEDEDGPIWNPVHRSLVRPDLVAGCERGPVVIIFVMAFLFICIFQTPFTVIVGALSLLMGFPLLRLAAKRDPYMYRIWMRHFAYRGTYAAHPGLGRPAPGIGVSPGSIVEQQRKKGSTA